MIKFINQKPKTNLRLLADSMFFFSQFKKQNVFIFSLI
jgi:hypothetical protein